MSLDLDKRQRAMLREMGVHVWQPLPPALPQTEAPVQAAALQALPQEEAPLQQAAAVLPATNLVAARADVASAAGQKDTQNPVGAGAFAPGETGLVDAGAAWQMGQAQALYARADDSPSPEPGARWLVLAETAAAALQAHDHHPFDGEAGRLLDNMLRAARLHQAAAVWLAPLVRGTLSGADGAAADLSSALPELLARTQPDLVLVMGRMAAQTLLQSAEPFGRLRGKVHMLHGLRTIVTHDAAYLLRMQGDKAKAWEDLCLAMSVAGAAPMPI